MSTLSNPVPLPGAVPVGTIMAFGGNVDDANVSGYLQSMGWLYCNGAAYDATEWPDLAEVIGTGWGGDGVETWYLPDLQGYFLRGVDDQAGGVDPDASTRLASILDSTSYGGNTGNAVGSLQEDQVGPITTSLQVLYSTAAEDTSPYGGYGMVNILGGNTWTAGDATVTQTLTTTTLGSETRPKNKYVFFIIYAGAQVTSS